MTVKCEKCGADVELQDGVKTAKCEKCGAEVVVKEEAAAEEKKEEAAAETAGEAAAEEKKEEAAPEKKPLTTKEKVIKITTLVVEIAIILVALAMVPRLCTRLHQHRMDSKGMPLAQEDNKKLLQYKNVDQEEVVLPGCFTSIGEGAFQDNNTVKSVTFRKTIKGIEKEAFKSCVALEEVKISGDRGAYALLDIATFSAFTKDNTPQHIGDSAFEFCLKLKKVELPAGITSIGTDAFANCISLTEIELPDTLERIGVRAFGQSGLKKVTIPDSVKVVGDFAFSGSKLEEISIPKKFSGKTQKWSLPEKCKIIER